MITEADERHYLARMERSIQAALEVVNKLGLSDIQLATKADSALATDVDRKLNDAIRAELLAPCEGWLSEEDPDDTARLGKKVVWMIDPLDGTREFLNGIPECCISVGLVIDRVPFAGALCNPITGELFIGSLHSGVTYNKQSVGSSARTSLDGALVLASRQEYLRGEWKQYDKNGFAIRPTGSIAYKLALVSAGLADATWTLTPKHEWDFAGGAALVRSSGGRVHCLGNQENLLNKSDTLWAGLIASSPGLWPDLSRLLIQYF